MSKKESMMKACEKLIEYKLRGRGSNLTGQRFGLLKVIGFTGNRRWLCKCDCGRTVKVVTSNLSCNRTKSCGCARKTNVRTLPKLNPAECRSYRKAKERCRNASCKDYKDYGGRGIEFRFESFGQFLEVMGRRPSTMHSVGRICNDGHYEPGNVRWEDHKQQANNTRRNVMVSIDGQSETMAYWCNHFGISHYNIYYRKKRFGMTTAEAILDLSRRTVTRQV